MAALRNSWGSARSRDAAAALGYVVVYVLLDWISYVQAISQLGITPWSPQVGLTLAVLILKGIRWAPLTALAAMLAEVFVRGMPAPLHILVAASVSIAGGYALAAFLLRPGRLYDAMDSPAGIVWLITVSAATSLAVSLAYVGVFAVSGALPQGDLVTGIRRYWLGDLNGILTMTPPMLALARRRFDARQCVSRRWELVAQLGAIVTILWFVFGWGRPETVRLFYLLFLPVLWVAFRWGATGAALCTLAVQIGLVITAPAEVEYPPVVDFQLLTVTLESTGLLIGVVVTQLAARNTEQRAILNTAPDGILSTTAAGVILSVNSAATRLFSAEEHVLVGQDVQQWLPGIQLLSDQGRCSLEARRLEQATFPVDVAWAKIEAPAPEGFILIFRDATERLTNESKIRERDTALARATRFAMLGELASAITHELNQPITALVSYLRATQILAAPLRDQDPRLTQTIEKANNEAIRTSVVLRRLRDFYRGGAPKPGSLNVADIIESTLRSFEDRLRQLSVRVQRETQANLPVVWCDQTQLEMVLVNLVTNAIDAVMQLPEEQRVIVVSAGTDGCEVQLRIEDSGPGLASDIADRIFDPFVTTKPDGMGLGLAISRSLLRSQGGDVWASASQYGGACFVLRIPTMGVAQIAV